MTPSKTKTKPQDKERELRIRAANALAVILEGCSMFCLVAADVMKRHADELEKGEE